MVKPQPAVDRLATQRHTALLLVAAVDRRIVPALRFLCRLPETEVRAVHVAVEAAESRRLAEDWMELGLTWMPLQIHDATAATFAASVRQAVRTEVEASGPLTVVVPELDFSRWWHPLLHRRSARRLAEYLQPVAGVTTVIVPYVASV